MSSKLLVSIVLVLLLAAGCAAPQVRSGDDLVLKETQERIVEGEYEVAINTMEAFVFEREKHPKAGLAHYLAGTAARGQLDADRQERGYSRIQNIFSINVFQTEDGPLMEKAYDHFMKAGRLTGDDELAAESIYMAGVMKDVEYMKHFPDALRHYKQVYEEYPETPWAGKAKGRYLTLQQYYKGVTGSPYQ